MRKNGTILFILIALLFSSCGQVKEATSTSSAEFANNETEQSVSSKASGTNQLITEEMWGEVPSEEMVSELCKTYEDKPRADYSNKESYNLMHMDSLCWILKNKEGQTLYCKDGLMYGDMPYYVLLSADKQTFKSDGVYDGGKFFVDASDEYTYIPADINNAGITIGMRISEECAEDAYMAWVYDIDKGGLTGTITSELYDSSHKNSVNDHGIYLYSGTNVEKVVISEESINIYGNNGSYGYIKVIDPTPPEIIFN